MSEASNRHPDERRSGKEQHKQKTDTSEPGSVEPHNGPDRRKAVTDRRLGLDRRRGPGRRRSEDRKAAEEGHMSDEQFEFLMAIDEYKKANSRPFPTWTEVLEIIKAIGYRKVADPQPLAESQSHTEDDDESVDGAPKAKPHQLAK